MTHHTVGIDISKAHLDAYAAPAGTAARFSNDAAGFRAPLPPRLGSSATSPNCNSCATPWSRTGLQTSTAASTCGTTWRGESTMSAWRRSRIN